MNELRAFLPDGRFHFTAENGQRYLTLRFLIPTLYALTPAAAIPALEVYLRAAGEQP